MESHSTTKGASSTINDPPSSAASILPSSSASIVLAVAENSKKHVRDKQESDDESSEQPPNKKMKSNDKTAVAVKKFRDNLIDGDDSSDDEKVEIKTLNYTKEIDKKWEEFKTTHLGIILEEANDEKDEHETEIARLKGRIEGAKQLIDFEKEVSKKQAELTTRAENQLSNQIKEKKEDLAKAKAKGRGSRLEGELERLEERKKEIPKDVESRMSYERRNVQSQIEQRKDDIKSYERDVGITNDKIKALLNEEDYQLSFLIHSLGIQLLYSREVQALYRVEKEKDLKNDAPIPPEKAYRKTLGTSHSFTCDTPYHFFANLRKSNRSQKRTIKNFENSKPLPMNYTVHRSWSFNKQHPAAVALEDQTLSTRLKRTDKVVNVGSYTTSIPKSINELKEIFNQYEQNITDSVIAQWIRNYFKGDLINGLNSIEPADRELALYLISGIAYLLFGCEVARSPASIILNQMMLDLIIYNKMEWASIGDEMPMATEKATKAARHLDMLYEKYMPYPYEYEGDSKQDDTLTRREADMVRKWLELQKQATDVTILQFQPLATTTSVSSKEKGQPAASSSTSDMKSEEIFNGTLEQYIEIIQGHFKNWFGESIKPVNTASLTTVATPVVAVDVNSSTAIDASTNISRSSSSRTMVSSLFATPHSAVSHTHQANVMAIQSSQPATAPSLTSGGNKII